jgi:hypothetical protein
MPHGHDDRLSAAERALLLLWFATALLFASAPLFLGVIVTVAVPGMDIRPGIPHAVVPVDLAAVIAVGSFVGGALDRAVRRALVRHRVWAGFAAEVASMGLLWLFLLPLMADERSAFVAAVASVLFFKATEPLMVWIDRRRGGGR